MALTTTATVREATPLSETSRWLLPILLLGNVLNVVDVFVVNVALPTLTQTLHATPAALELVVAGYSVAFACFLVAGGRLGDSFGRRRLFMIGMAGFTVASAICGLAPTANVLIAARLGQGVTAALMVPQVLGTIQVIYQGAARQRALGIFGAIMGLAAAAAQILGGLLVSADLFGLSWRPAFLVNIPVGIFGLLAARRVIPDSRSPQAAPIDGLGTTLLGATVILLLVPLTLGREEHWPLWCWILLGAVPFTAAAFAAVQARKERRGTLPLLPPSLLRSPGMLPGLAVGLVFFAAFGGMMLITTVAFQFGLRYSPVKAGLTLSPYALAFLASSLLVRRLVARYGKYVIILGAFVLAFGFGLLAFQAHQGFAGMTPLSFAPALAVIGFTQGMVAIPLVGVVLSGIPPERAGVAAGVFSTGQQIAVAIGIAAIGTLFFSLAASHGFGVAFTASEIVEAAASLVTAAVAAVLPHSK